MIREPWFWRDDSFAARAIATCLTPLALVYDAGRRIRELTASAEISPIPVICVGAATLGGVGKTPFSLLAEALLRENGVAAHFLTRGYGGALAGPIRVDLEKHGAQDVGDEALLLAATAPTWVARRRIEGARRAADAGAGVVIMDDGYQNAAIVKTLNILLIDATDRAGNGRIFPAGPLRESEGTAQERAGAIVYVTDGPELRSGGDTERPVFAAWLEARAVPAPEKTLAFCGIARPARFFAMLNRLGHEIVDAVAFPDHHPFTESEILQLKHRASASGARLMTTRKDFVRLPHAFREDIGVIDVTMKCSDPAKLSALLMHATQRHG